MVGVLAGLHNFVHVDQINRLALKLFSDLYLFCRVEFLFPLGSATQLDTVSSALVDGGSVVTWNTASAGGLRPV